MQKEVGATKRLTKLVKDKYPDTAKRFFGRRNEGILSFDFQRLALLKVEPEKVSVEWNPKVLALAKIDKASITAEFLSDGKMQWCP